MPVDKPTIREQVKHMSNSYVWGTHLEIKVAAIIFQMPIYYCVQSEQSGAFNWNVMMPISTRNMKFPIIIDDILKEKEDISHIEMYYHKSHYEVIVSIDSGKVCGVLPQLTGKTNLQLIDLTN